MLSTPDRLVRRLTGVAILISLLIGAAGLSLIRWNAVDGAKASLSRTVHADAQLIEAVARFDAAFSHDFPGGSRAATLSQIREAFQTSSGHHWGSQFAYAERGEDGAVIIELFPSQDKEEGLLARQSIEVPLRRALAGLSGLSTVRDPEGREWLVAFAPVAGLDLGLAVIQSLDQVTTAAWRTAALLGAAVALAVMLSAIVFNRATTPLINHLEHGRQTARRSDALLRSVADALPSAVSFVDQNQVYRFANATYEAWWGRPRHLVENHTVKEVVGIEVYELMKPYLDSALLGKSLRFDMPVTTKDGVERELRMFYLPQFGDDGRVEGAVVLAEDFSDLRRSEDQLRVLSSAIDQSPHMVVVTDPNGVIEYVNPSFCQKTGFTSDETVGNTPLLFRSEVTPKAVHRDIWNEISNGRTWHGELQNARSDGTPFWVSAMIAPIRDPSGRVTHFMALEEDITERKLSEQELHQAIERAEVANRAKTALLANMSHELRTPLNAIIGYSETLLLGVFGPVSHPKQTEYLRDIRASGEHLLALINDVLDVSAIEAGRVDLSNDRFDLKSVIESSLRLVRPRAETGRVKLLSSLPERLPIIHADERRIKQVLVNILNNGVKFTEEGGQVKVVASIEPDGGLAVIISDTGLGMDAQQLDLAVQPFGQVDNGLNRKYEGNGLGLPLSINLMELHGGALSIDSAPGQGTRVTLRLPPNRVESFGAKIIPFSGNSA